MGQGLPQRSFESNEIAPLVVVIEGLDNGDPPEIPAIRNALDDGLRAEGKGQSCRQVASTIFPVSLWNLQRPRADLYQRYLGIVHRIRKHRGNRHGVYFQRLIAFGADIEEEEDVNQLEHIITTWRRGNHRRSALQASLVDPRLDHTHQRQRGFPCLQQVAFAPVRAMAAWRSPASTPSSTCSNAPTATTSASAISGASWPTRWN